MLQNKRSSLSPALPESGKSFFAAFASAWFAFACLPFLALPAVAAINAYGLGASYDSTQSLSLIHILVSIMFSWGGNEGDHTIFNMNTSLLGGSPRPSLH